MVEHPRVTLRASIRGAAAGLLNRQPAIGKVLATAMGAVEVSMLQVLDFIGTHVSKDFKIRFMRTFFKKKWGGRVVPLGVNFSAETRFLPSQEIYGIVSRSSAFAIGTCYCRTKHKRCDNPTDTCILLGPKAGHALAEIPYRTASFTRVSKERIIQVLDDADKRGLVHQTIFFPTPDYFYVICNCCTCCCEALHDFKRFGTPAVVKSDFIERTDATKCTGCGACVPACPFDARAVVEGRVRVVPGKCFGCGVCARRCPEGAISLVRRA
ncbi:MAG: 4Fe-4S binding protein [Candidatus Lokiarchaeota archaeon]|nr:4Fe-4S binding protein [Candidatus Lokiarchaeota archaeon]